MAETETRRWYVSRPRRRDRDHNPVGATEHRRGADSVGASRLGTRAENYPGAKHPSKSAFILATFSIETLGYCALVQRLMMLQCVVECTMCTFARDVIL